MERYFVKICLLGEGAVGKTSLIRRFVYDSYDDQYIKSIGVKVTKKKLVFEDDQIELDMLISDILGQMTRESLHASYLQGVKGVILVCDLTRRDTFDKLGSWINLVRSAVGSPPIILLGNKADLKEHRKVGDEDLETLSRELGCTYLHTSAKTGENVERAFELLGRKMMGCEIDEARNKEEIPMKDVTDMPVEPLPPREEEKEIAPFFETQSQHPSPQTPAMGAEGSALVCPNCKSADIQVFPDGSGICENCDTLLSKVEDKETDLVEEDITGAEDTPAEDDAPVEIQEPDDAGAAGACAEKENRPSAMKMSPVQAAFFNVPVAALRELKDRLSILLASKEGGVEAVMGEYGYDCGKAASLSMDVKCTREELGKMLPDLWIGIGLSKVDVDLVSEDRIDMAMYEMEIEEPDFFGGYLAGVVSGMLGEEFRFAICDMKDYLKITLEPGIQTKVALEELSTEAEKYTLEKGSSYIIQSTNDAYKVFKEKATHGMEGMCITREYPPRVREKYGLTNTPIYWFSDSSTTEETSFNPSRLAFEVKRALNEFMKESKSGVILLQGAEYLISHQGFSEVLKWLQGIRDQGAMSGTTILICADPNAMDEREFRNLSLEFPVLEIKR